ncbi:DUF4241 domain-containing protein [Actinoplanes sp. NPDC051475]|uniref:DUF4241 domain-containing protein n=1 Tax=Actinoplanes sp. NPDC051475 TaxID=3157225 RepID=UPI00344B565E
MAVDIGEMLDRLLTEGAHHFDDTHDYRLTMIPIGAVTLPTGHVVACDPLSGPDEMPPFTVTVPPGRYGLRAWVAVAQPARRSPGRPPPGPGIEPATPVPARGGQRAGSMRSPGHGAGTRHPGADDRPVRHGLEADRRTAALELVVRDEPVASWEPAVPAQAGPSFCDEDGFFAYPADCGAATLADQRAVTALRAWPYERVEETYLPDPGPPAPAALGAVTDPATGANVVAVGTGWDDGGYATFVGRTAGGEVAAFVTDFRVL